MQLCPKGYMSHVIPSLSVGTMSYLCSHFEYGIQTAYAYKLIINYTQMWCWHGQVNDIFWESLYIFLEYLKEYKNFNLA